MTLKRNITKQKQSDIGRNHLFQDQNKYLLLVNLILISIIIICASVWMYSTINQIIEHVREINIRTK
ncbi:MAG: hypothetical protein J0H55_08675 [Chitinophagaceae bacterium]|nr:hypothetical protein [Chitinophagaceae bacterium]